MLLQGNKLLIIGNGLKDQMKNNCGRNNEDGNMGVMMDYGICLNILNI